MFTGESASLPQAKNLPLFYNLCTLLSINSTMNKTVELCLDLIEFCDVSAEEY